DFHVTGVQTCALPIWLVLVHLRISQKLVAGDLAIGEQHEGFDPLATGYQQRLALGGGTLTQLTLADLLAAPAQHQPGLGLADFEIGRASCSEGARSSR